MGHRICLGLAEQSHREDVLITGPREREPRKRRPNVARLEVVPVAELKTRLSAKLVPLVEEYKDKLTNRAADVGGKLVLEKGDDPKDLRKALKAAAGSGSRSVGRRACSASI
jgi:hypothetical protein